MTSEAFSRVVIDRKLREAGWNPEDSNQIVFEDHGNVGRADYVLKDENNKPIAIVEAKKPEIDPYSAKDQAHSYVKLQYPGVDYIYLANDNIIYFWDLGQGDAVPVSAFFSQEDLMRKRQTGRVGNVEQLTHKTVTEDYFEDISDRVKLRPYQIEAWDAIAQNFDRGKRNFLLEMATGTGKTALSALIISKFLRTNNARSILFIVDRKQLAIQTKNEFEQLLHGVAAVGTYWGSNRKNLVGANVIIATIQSLKIHGTRDFSAGYFDVVIHDEAHRSIYSLEARAVVDHFIGVVKIGLTATPKDFLKNIDSEKLAVNDPRALERRLQKDTYAYFGCADGQPTYRYSIQDGVKDGYLVSPRYHKMNTVLTQAALSEQGLDLMDVNLEEGETFHIRDLEKKVYLPERNRAMMEEFLRYADRTPHGEIGKTIIFAVSQSHALALEKILNALNPEYNGLFASTITSIIKGAHELAKDFARESVMLPRVAVTVDMLSTGFNCPEVLNIVFARPVFDPTTYQQIKGRGTRPCPAIQKDHFAIYDFCGVVEYFDEQYDWTAPLSEPIPRSKTSKVIYGSLKGFQVEDSPYSPLVSDGIPTSLASDNVAIRGFITYGPSGDKVDQEMYRDEWEKAVNSFAERHKTEVAAFDETEQKIDKLLEDINNELLNQPKFYFNEDSLSVTYRVVADVRDFFMAALGKHKLPSRQGQLEELKQGLVNKFSPEKGASMKRKLMVEYLATQIIENEELLKNIQQEPNIRFLADPLFVQAFPTGEWLEEFGKEGLLEMISDISQAKILKV